MNSLLNEKELITFTFRFIDIILNNVDTPKFKKNTAFDSIKNFARLRGLNIDDEVYTFRINDKSFIVALFDNDITPAKNIKQMEYFCIDKNLSNDNKVMYIFVPSQDKYYSYEDNNLNNILYSVLNMFEYNDIFDINYYNYDINSIVNNSIRFIILTIVLYFTLEDNLDTKREINNFISNHFGSKNTMYSKIIDNVYDDLFKYVNTYEDPESIISTNYYKIIDNILEYLEVHYNLLKHVGVK